MKREDFESIEDVYIISRWLYSISEETPITDAEYNAINRQFIAEKRLEEYTNRTWSNDPCPIELLKKYGLERFKYDIVLGDKSESMPSITEESVARDRYKNAEGPFVVSYKEDGINLQRTYFNGKLVNFETRGRHADPINLSHLMDKLKVQDIPMMGEVKITGEGQLSNESFQKLKEITGKPLVSQRSSVKSALSSKETAHLIDMHDFDIKVPGKQFRATEIYYLLNEWGFTTPQYIVVERGSEVVDAVKRLAENYEAYGYRADGSVVRSDVGGDLMAVRIFAWEEEVFLSYVTGVEESPSDLYIGCKLLINPCFTGQSTQRRLNITNLKTIQMYKLFRDSPIAFTLRSQAIADIDLNTTMELQKAWSGKEQEYKDYIKDKEYIKSMK